MYIYIYIFIWQSLVGTCHKSPLGRSFPRGGECLGNFGVRTGSGQVRTPCASTFNFGPHLIPKGIKCVTNASFGASFWIRSCKENVRSNANIVSSMDFEGPGVF